MRVPKEWNEPLEGGRVLLVPACNGPRGRVTADNARKRSEFTASLTDKLLVVHAVPGSTSEAMFGQLAASEKRIVTLKSAHNDASERVCRV
jgi:hypothetical protein